MSSLRIAGRLLLLSCLAACLLKPADSRAGENELVTFARQELTNVYFSEGVAAGDLNGDNAIDIVYGPYWFAGPDFTDKHEIFAAKPQPTQAYADHFFSWVYDFDSDGANDIFVVGFPGTPAFVYQNPGDGIGPWTKHQVMDWVSNESPQFVNLVGSQAPELVCTRDGFFGFATFDPSEPLGAWKFHAVSAQTATPKFGHGLGVGDVNGDGRPDILHAGGWFEQPSDTPLTSRWPEHATRFSTGGGGADMFAYDVDGDGDQDVITSESAHNFGLSWYEQRDAGEFQQHTIMGAQPEDNKYGVLFSELHSLALADMDGDGLKDIVTGKTYWSHHKQSPMWDAGAVVTWFKLKRGAKGVDWLPFQADGQAGIGRQLTVADVNADGLPDIVTGGMLGANALIQSRQQVTPEQFSKAQPKIYVGPKLSNPSQAKAARAPRAELGADRKVAMAIEGESLNAKVTAGAAQPQAMQDFKADRWSGDSQLWWRGGGLGDRLTLELDALQDIAALELALTCARDYAIVQIRLDDQPLGDPIDLFDTQVVSTGALRFDTPCLVKGKHTLAFEIVGSNPAAVKAHMVGIDFLRFRGRGKQFSESSEEVRLDTVAEQPVDDYPHRGLAAEKAAAAMRVPEGFRVTVCASEPDVKQPIAMALDDRGRTWIAEAYEYPQRASGDIGRDRILVFEDTTGDGKFDSRKIFAEGLNLVSGLEVGFGGVWVGAAPYLMFIPDANGDDVADSAPQILLDGWGYEDTHETLNTFCWGPDGWLYGCHGVFTHSKVGKPGAADNQRTPINAGVWRYHPVRHEFEVFAHGTSNPWGVDFNAHGEAFVTACVIPHLYHMIPGARYERQAGRHFNPHTYDDIKTIADHLHYLGSTPHSGNGRSDAAGGGHAHAGAMFYQGGAWPKQYHDALFMNNIHGQRLNTDLLEPSGSGYVGHHGPDFLLAGDMASQILNMRYGPDGQVIFIDWYDMQACHRKEVEVHDRSNGRICKVSYGTPQPVAVNLGELDDVALAELCLHDNDWYVRHSRRILQERSAHRAIDVLAIQRLQEIANNHPDETRRLRAMWARNSIGAMENGWLEQLMRDPSPHVRGWALRLAAEQSRGLATAPQLVALATRLSLDASPIVRRAVASVVDRLPYESRWQIVESLAAHAEDANDHNLPLMVWYGMEPLAEVDPDRALALGLSAGKHIPLLQQYMLRRLGGSGDPEAVDRLLTAIAATREPSVQLTLLTAIRSALSGQRTVAKPASWDALYAELLGSQDANVALQATALHATALQATALGVTFGDKASISRMRAQLANNSIATTDRLESMSALLAAKDGQLAQTLLEIVQSKSESDSMREAAIRGLAQYDEPTIAPALVALYPQMNESLRRSSIATLCARVAGAKALLNAIAEKSIASMDLTADLARQLEYLGNEEVSGLLAESWGQVRQTPADLAGKMKDYQALIERTDLDPADESLGRALFAKTCQRCHKLYGEGEQLGPDLTGSNRANLAYLLENIIDPSAVMAKEYRQSIFLTDDGQVVSGILLGETSKAVTVRTAEATVVLPKDEIAQTKTSDKSMMPENQLSQFSEHEIRSLVAYLRSKNQVSLTK